MVKITSATLAGFMLSFAASLLVGNCSSSSSNDDPHALCVQACNKAKECAGPLAASLDCTMSCNSEIPTNTSACTNLAEVTAKVKECLAKPSCPEFITCSQAVPDPNCPGSTAGTGGTTGAGGTGTGAGGTGGAGTGGAGTGTGGAGGSATDAAGGDASCEDCAKIDRCGAAFADAGTGLANACNAATGAARAQLANICKASAAALPNCP